MQITKKIKINALHDLFHGYLDYQQAIKALLLESTPDEKLRSDVLRQLASIEAIILKEYKKNIDF